MTSDYRTCRFCQEGATGLLKYGVRHYAHAACGLEAEGAAFLDHFHPWQLKSQFPYMAAKKAGVADLLVAKIEAGGEV